MSKYAMNVVTMILAFLTFNASAQTVVEKQIETVKMFPVATVLRDNSEQIISVIETGIVTDANGDEAKGPHDVIIELDATSEMSVVIGGQTLGPGESVTLQINLSETGHKLSLPVHPAVSNQMGKVSYSIRIPEIRVSLCPEGYLETESDCYRVEHSEITYICPIEFEYAMDIKDCRKHEFVDLVGQCPPDYTENTAANTCELNLSENAVQECPLGYVETDGVCEQKDVVNVDACPSGYTELDGGQCQKLESSTAASNCPSGYTFNSSESVCEKPYPGEEPESEFCASSEVEYMGVCHTKHNEYITHNGDGRYDQDPQNPNLFHLNSFYYTNMEQCGSYFPYDGGPFDDWSSYRLCYHSTAVDMPPLTLAATGCYSGQAVTDPATNYFTCIDTSEDPKPKSGSCFNAGYTYNANSGMCEMPPDTASVGQYCGNEESETPPYCHTYSYVDQGLNCPTDYVYDNAENLCVNLIDTQPLTITCPTDYALSGDNQTCTYSDTIQIGMTCPIAYVRVGDGTVCEKEGVVPVETVDATANCPADYEYIGNLSCQKTIIESAAYECPEGYQPSENLESCEKETRMPYVY